MKSKITARSCLFLLFVTLCLSGPIRAQTPATTTVEDTVYRSDGSVASGTVVIKWPAFVTGDGRAVFGGTKTLPLANGALAVALAPNAEGSPSGTSYHVRYFQSGGVFFEETWVVPASNPVASPAAPTSVTQTGTPGTTTYHYWVSATNANGETLLGIARVTTTSNATLSMTNYNVINWAAVAGATGYRVWRTSTSTAPTGTGNYLVGSTASTTLNDQSNTLTSATVPALNTTDPRSLSDVRVTAAPSPSVTLAAAQVQGNAIVSNPSATQTITAPSGSGIPLVLKGRSGNTSDIAQWFDNTATPKQTLGVTSAGQLYAEGGTEDGFEGFFVFTNPTADRNWTFPNADATLVQPDAGASNNFLTAVSALGVISKAQPAFSNLSGAATLAQLPFGSANQILGTNAGGTAQEHKTLTAGTAGADFAITHAANQITFNLPDASATARGVLTTGTQTIAGAKTLTNDLSLDGNSARAINTLRHTTANTAGNALTVLAGGATSGATDKAGGALLLQPGLGTGSSIPALARIQQDTLGTASGTSDHARVDRLITGATKVLTDATNVALVNATIASNTVVAGIVSYAVEVFNGTDVQIEEGKVSYHATNKAGTVANNTTVKFGNQQAATAGTLTCTWTITAASPAVLTLNCDTSLTPSAGYPRVTFSLENLTQQAVAVQ